MTSADTIKYSKVGFDSEVYCNIQAEKIAQRVNEFKGGRLYLEIGGKFLFDGHASRVLPGFDPEVKVEIMKKVGVPFDLIFCVNAKDILHNRFLNTDSTSYVSYVDSLLLDFEKAFNEKPSISINLIDSENSEKAMEYREKMEGKGYKVFNRYHIEGYPDAKSIISEDGYGKDEHIEDLNKLVLVVGAASNSGKMSTCLGQIYNDHVKGIESGYAKYETFPIWNLPLLHPVNLAYESATVDIGDYNMIDKYHLYHYGVTSVNYNRDVAAFTIVENLIKKMVSPENFISTYKSPTDMGVNTVKEGITNDEIISVASYNEILRRQSWYYDLRNEKPNAIKWSDMCEQLAIKAKKYIDKKKYRLDVI